MSDRSNQLATGKSDHGDHYTKEIAMKTDDGSIPSPDLRYHFERELFGHGIFIASGGTLQLGNIPKLWSYNTDQLVACFDRVTSSSVNKHKFFADLINTFHVMYGINLYLVVFNAPNCNIMEPYNQTSKNLANSTDSDKFAVMYIDEQTWQCYSVFIQRNESTCQTIFSRDEMLNSVRWNDFLENRNLPVQTQNECSNSSVVVDHDENFNVGSQPLDRTSYTSKTVSELLDDLKQIFLAYGTSVTVDKITVPSSAMDISHLKLMSQENRNDLLNGYLSALTKASHDMKNGWSVKRGLPTAPSRRQPFPVLEQTEIMDISNDVIQGNFDDRNEIHHLMEETDNRENRDQSGVSNVIPSIGEQDAARIYDAPKISVKPKRECRDRNLRDLVLVQKQKRSKKKTRKSKDKVCSNSKKCRIGLLQGIGPQRTRPQVEIPDRIIDAEYLACQVETIVGQPHPQKFIVPKGTIAEKGFISHENYLQCLNFNGCDPNDHFDPDQKIVYLKITREDRRTKIKEILVYLLTLYQNSVLDKERIEAEQLDEYKLAFWFCKKYAGNYATLSPKSRTWIIKSKPSKP